MKVPAMKELRNNEKVNRMLKSSGENEDMKKREEDGGKGCFFENDEGCLCSCFVGGKYFVTIAGSFETRNLKF